MTSPRKAGSETLADPKAPSSDSEYVAQQVEVLEEGLGRFLSGDNDAAIQMQEGDSAWADLATHINIALNTARDAIQVAGEAERRASIARDEALAAARSEARFLTNVSHELRTPLSSIRAAAEILKNYPEESEETKGEFSDIILQESDRLARLIENVLDLTKIQAQRLHWDFRELHPCYSLAEVVRSFNQTEGGGGVRVQLTVDHELPTTFGDRDRLKQVWTNLIDNALKFSPSGEKVWVRAHHGGGAIIVEVRDFGSGISKTDQKTIFDRFQQITGDALTDKPDGTGLGLAIAKEIVTHHGGEIRLDSQPGKGSAFRVVLPVPQQGDLEVLQELLRREAQ